MAPGRRRPLASRGSAGHHKREGEKRERKERKKKKEEEKEEEKEKKRKGKRKRKEKEEESSPRWLGGTELGGGAGDVSGGRLKLMRKREREEIEGWRRKRRGWRERIERD